MTYDVYGMGNALVDLEFEADFGVLEKFHIKKGVMTLVDENHQRRVIDHLGGRPRHRCCGGSVGNSMAVLGSLGGKGLLSCKVANDEEGNFYYKDLLSHGIETNLPRGIGPTGKCLVLVTPDGDRTMNTFMGVTALFSREELVESELEKSTYLYIEGYLMDCKSAVEAAVMAKKKAQDSGVNTALTFSDLSVVTDFRENLEVVIGEGVDLLFCNEKEAMAFVGKEDEEAAFEGLKSITQSFAMTRGPKGAVLWDGNKKIEIATTEVVKPVDTNGAGDTFAGCFLYGITRGKDFRESAKLACAAATKVVGHFGTRPSREYLLSLKAQMFGRP